jgi:hypothetical protein
MKAIVDGDKNNLQEKMQGSNKFEFKKICDKLETKFGIKDKDLMGLGTSCIVYKYGHHSVIKVCAKKIKFFHNRKSKSAEELKKTTDPIAPFLLPIEKIIYDGDAFFAYVQARCKPLPKKDPITAQNVIDILHIIEAMFSNGLLVGQMKPKNVGFHNGHLVLFDYHSMHPLYDRIKSKPDWYKSMTESLMCYNHLLNANGIDLKLLIEKIKKSKTQHDIAAVLAHIGDTKKALARVHK